MKTNIGKRFLQLLKDRDFKKLFLISKKNPNYIFSPNIRSDDKQYELTLRIMEERMLLDEVINKQVVSGVFNLEEHKDKFVMSHGELNSLQITYETYGKLNKDRTNAILVCHALTGDHHVAGIYEGDKRKGWWDHAVGPGKAIDTDEFFVICSNCLGACQGSTGPTSINPVTDKPYGMSFPDLTIKDMVSAQKLLLDHLKVKSLYSVVGGSMGGMQALQWIVEFPKFVESAIIIAATPQHSAQTIAFINTTAHQPHRARQ